MENSVQILIEWAGAISGPVNLFFATLTDGGVLLSIGVIALAAAAAISYSNIPAELLAAEQIAYGNGITTMRLPGTPVPSLRSRRQ